MFINLHNHTDHSLFDGYQTVKELVSRVKELNQSAVAITEHGTLSSVLGFYYECKEQGIKPIIGNEFYFCESKYIKDRALTYHLILLAKDETGYKNLKELNYISYQKSTNNYYFKPRIDWNDLESHSKGLICLTACLGSILNTDRYMEHCMRFKKIFKGDLFLELQPHPIQEQIDYNTRLIELSKQLSLPLIVTSDSHYSTKEQAGNHKNWIGIHKAEYYQTDTNYLFSESELENSHIPKDVIKEAIHNTTVVADRCVLTIGDDGDNFPTYPTKNGCEDIRTICRKVWWQKVPKEKSKEYAARFNYELEMLERCNYVNYMLLTWDFLNWCKEQGIVVGVGRGSVGGSLVAYLLGIHCVDPIKHNLLFERFCNPERITPPDVDNDVQTSRRRECISYLKRLYGNVTKVKTYSYLSHKSAIQRAGQLLGITVDNYTKDIESLEDIFKIEDSELTRKLYNIAKGFIGRLQAFGSHASAVLITPRPTIEFVPMEFQNINDESIGSKVWDSVAAGDFHTLESKFGLMKLDVLGLGTLDVIDNVLKNTDSKIDIYNLPTDDEKVFKTYADGNLLGVFQMESTGMRQVAKDMKVNKFSDIVALVALYRPGPIGSGMLQSYIDGKNGKEINYPCKELKEILGETYGVIVYQEQVMKIARTVAGYSIGQADMLRKIIGRKEEDKINQATEELKQAIIGKGFSESIADYICKQVVSAGRYIFNKSHAAEYGYLSYITAHLKTYYPLQFMTALINSKKKQEDVIKYIDECKRLNIKILPPSLDKGNREWIVEDNSIRVGLSYIKGVGDNLVIPSQAEKPLENTFLNVVFLNNKGITESLIKAGALDFCEPNRGSLLQTLLPMQKALKREKECLEKIEHYKQIVSEAKKGSKEEQKGLRGIATWEKKLNEIEQVGQLHDKDYKNAVGEMEVLGFSFSTIPKVKKATIESFATFNDKRNREMARITFNTEYGKYTLLCFSSTWCKIKKKVQKDCECVIADEKGLLKDIQI